MKSFTMDVLLVAAIVFSRPSVSIGTNFLNHGQLLTGVEDPSWYEDNVPFLDVPDQGIQEVYYYRLQTYKEHLTYTGAQYGYLSSEFLQPVSYGAPYGGIVAAAGHHIIEGRWLRDQRYGQDIVNYWLAGPGQFGKPQNDHVNLDASDWAHEYSFWAASAVWRQYLVTGDRDFAVGQLDNLVKQYRGWDNHFNADLGLYWQVPVWDATECSAASYESGDPYHGGAGYRPTINAYQYGDARAIASIASLSGQTAVAEEYAKRADALRTSMQKYLWDSQLQFFKHRARDNNPDGQLITTREYMGYVPWMFNMPQASNATSFSQLKDPQGFASRYGPTTAERRSKWFMNQGANCLQWNGPSWPFATSQVLTAVENLLHDYPAQSSISATDYFNLLLGYVATQHKNGKPYIAEAHDPDGDGWMYDSPGHSEDYNHSTFIDNIIAGLLGLRGQPDNTLKVNPLVPSTWDYFALENVAYHGHTVTVIWDKTGQRYGQGAGLQAYVDGRMAASRDTLGPLSVNVGPAVSQAISPQVNIAANTQRFSQGTTPFASYTSPYDDVWRAVDGIVFRNAVPQNSRWTSYDSPNAQDHFGVDLRRPQAVSDVRLYFYDDGGGVRLPPRYDLQYLAGDGAWTTVPGQKRSAATSTSNAQTRITFPVITTSQLRVVAPNAAGGTGWGLSEFEVWMAAVFQMRNENSGKLMGVENASKAASANIQQYEDNGSLDHLWEFTRTSSGWYKIKNVNSGLLLGVEGASKASNARLQQYLDNGSDDHFWRVQSDSNGLFLLHNKNSGLVAGVAGESTANRANVVQSQDNGTRDQLWSLLAAVPAS
ncbi:carbohydrate-binding module family 13 protein [Parachaetomium inaequale]|uniref:Carbohydrate-binding module family 13 protein n=1 Tax=Parachaetomium inaequale TaxID=2588326 RepID=A0AAN6SRZ2_9PEZI|nr:carbohydrate-binding module family 13 protein [Parachaetomium inaequale]